LHGEPAQAEENQITPLPRGGRQPESDAGDEDQAECRDHGAPCGEVVHADESVCAFADRADHGVGAGGADDADHGDAYCGHSLRWGYVV